MKKYVYGDIIGNSTFIEYTDQRLSGEVVSKFRCSCGKIFYAVCRRLNKRKILAGCKDCLNEKLLEKRAAVKNKTRNVLFCGVFFVVKHKIKMF